MNSKVDPQQSSVGNVTGDTEPGEYKYKAFHEYKAQPRASAARSHFWHLLEDICQAAPCDVQFWATVIFFFSLVCVTQVLTVIVESSPPRNKQYSLYLNILEVR